MTKPGAQRLYRGELLTVHFKYPGLHMEHEEQSPDTGVAQLLATSCNEGESIWQTAEANVDRSECC